MLFFLNGFMGSGKTHWGKIWAANYKLGFLDLDEAIEIEERKSVVDIFESRGEAYFRATESRILKECLQLKTTIVACGGGTPCYQDNMQWMNDHGITIYISSPPEENFKAPGKRAATKAAHKKIEPGRTVVLYPAKIKREGAILQPGEYYS